MIKLQLVNIKNIFQEKYSFESAWTKCTEDLIGIFNIEQVRLYKRDPKKTELFSVVQVSGQPLEIRLPFSTSSIAGYTALTQLPFVLKSLNEKELQSIHVDLSFDTQYDNFTGVKTKNLISMPIQHENSFMGVLQLVNKVSGDFSREDEAFCRLLVNIMGQKLVEEYNLPRGPYEQLVFRGLITQKQLEDAQEKSSQRPLSTSYFLQADYDLSVKDIGASLELFYQTPFVQFANNPVSDKMLKRINRQYLIKNIWLPWRFDGDHVVVLVSNPHDIDKNEEIRRIVNAKSYEFRVALQEEILAFLGDFSQLPPKVRSKLEENKAGDATLDPGDFLGDSGEDPRSNSDLASALAGLAGEADEELESAHLPEEDISQESRQLAVRFVNQIIMHAHKIGASDIHIEPSRTGRPGLVRMRIDGSCEEVLSLPESTIKPVVSRIKIISNLDISERRLPQDGKARVRFKGRDLELRIATLPTVNGESVVLRMLSSGQSLPFEKLNLSKKNQAEIERLMIKPHGIFLVVGPTGSGKTTTLHSILAKINTPDKKIWTVEDPVEITQPGLQQVQVDSAIGLDFPRIMRSFLRADPDVILVGEMRDFQTAQIGVEASLTGHMVFSTLHTNSAPETVTRLLDMGIEPLNFSEALQGVLAQRLVKTLCSSCKQESTPSDEVWEHLIKQYGQDFFPELQVQRSSVKIFTAKGCARCGQSGYRGRTGIHELLVATPEIRKAIVQKQSAEAIATLAIEQGMRTLYQDGIAKVIKGDIDIFQLQKVTVSD
ncbi:MAG: ATPase, T2SS/T4P/T4SS family [Desulfomicrobium sp.]|nr:ATPase, T2SS/T4P/T4SS family [Desulfomicrobium sp.]